MTSLQILFVKTLTLWYASIMERKCKGFIFHKFTIFQPSFHKRKGVGSLPLSSHSERLMGTTITISLVDERADSLLQKSFDLLRELEYRFNANSQESELMEINHQAGIAPVKVHPDLFELISLGLEHSLAPSSHLNISIGPLIQTWRIGFQMPRSPSLKKLNRCSL